MPRSVRSRFAAILPLALGLASASLAACQDQPIEPPPAPKPATPQVSTQHDATHVIVASDHRRMIVLRVDDRIQLPVDPGFNWRIELEDKSAFARYTAADAGFETYTVTKAGLLRVMVFGDPKCPMKGDATDPACAGISKRRWDITFNVQ